MVLAYLGTPNPRNGFAASVVLLPRLVIDLYYLLLICTTLSSTHCFISMKFYVFCAHSHYYQSSLCMFSLHATVIGLFHQSLLIFCYFHTITWSVPSIIYSHYYQSSLCMFSLHGLFHQCYIHTITWSVPSIIILLYSHYYQSSLCMFSLHGLFHQSLFCYNTDYKGTYAISVSISGRSFGSIHLLVLSQDSELFWLAGTIHWKAPVPEPVL